MPCPYKLSSVLCHLLSVICHLYSVHFLPLRQGEYHEVGRGYVNLSLSVFRLHHTPSALRVCPTSQWGLRPSEGTEWHSVIPLKTLFAPYLRGTKWIDTWNQKHETLNLPHLSPPLPSVICTLYSVLCTLLSVLCHLYSLICTLSPSSLAFHMHVVKHRITRGML